MADWNGFILAEQYRRILDTNHNSTLTATEYLASIRTGLQCDPRQHLTSGTLYEENRFRYHLGSRRSCAHIVVLGRPRTVAYTITTPRTARRTKLCGLDESYTRLGCSGRCRMLLPHALCSHTQATIPTNALDPRNGIWLGIWHSISSLLALGQERRGTSRPHNR